MGTKFTTRYEKELTSGSTWTRRTRAQQNKQLRNLAIMKEKDYLTVVYERNVSTHTYESR